MTNQNKGSKLLPIALLGGIALLTMACATSCDVSNYALMANAENIVIGYGDLTSFAIPCVTREPSQYIVDITANNSFTLPNAVDASKYYGCVFYVTKLATNSFGLNCSTFSFSIGDSYTDIQLPSDAMKICEFTYNRLSNISVEWNVFLKADASYNMTIVGSQTYNRNSFDYPDLSDFRTSAILSMESFTISKFNIRFGYNILGGYVTGYDTGHEVGYSKGYNQGVADGYQQGYNAGVTSDGFLASLGSLMGTVVMLPVQLLINVLDFDVFGVNIASFVRSLITIVIVLFIIRLIFNMPVKIDNGAKVGSYDKTTKENVYDSYGELSHVKVTHESKRGK